MLVSVAKGSYSSVDSAGASSCVGGRPASLLAGAVGASCGACSSCGGTAPSSSSPSSGSSLWPWLANAASSSSPCASSVSGPNCCVCTIWCLSTESLWSLLLSSSLFTSSTPPRSLLCRAGSYSSVIFLMTSLCSAADILPRSWWLLGWPYTLGLALLSYDNVCVCVCVYVWTCVCVSPGCMLN